MIHTVKSDVNAGQFIHDIFMWFEDGTDRYGNPFYYGPVPLRGLWVDARRTYLTSEAQIAEEEARMILPGIYYNTEYVGTEYTKEMPDDLLTMRFNPHDDDIYGSEGMQPSNWQLQQVVHGTSHQILIRF